MNPTFTRGQIVFFKKPDSRTWAKMEVVEIYSDYPAIRIQTYGKKEEWVVKLDEVITEAQYENLQ